MDCPANCHSQHPQEVRQPVEHRYGKIDTAGLKELFQSGTSLVLLDARSGPYDDGNRIPGAHALAMDATEEQAAQLIPSKDSLVVVYCTNLHCPAGAHLAERLFSFGYKNVLKYGEGIQQWMALGNPVQPASEVR